MEGIGTRSKKKLTHMMKKKFEKKLVLGKHTLFGKGRWSAKSTKKNCECWSIFYVPPLPWYYYAVAGFLSSDVVC